MADIIISLSAVMYLIGIALCYRATRNLLSSSMFVLYIWFFILIGGINYCLVEGHLLTPIVVGFAALSFGLGTKLATIFVGFKPKQELRGVSAQQLSWGIIGKEIFKIAIVTTMFLALVAAFIILRNSPLLSPGMLKTGLIRPGQGPLVRLFRDGLPILAVMWVLLAIKAGKPRSWIGAGLVIVITSVVLMLTGYKGFVLWFVVLLAVALGYLKPHSRHVKLTVGILLVVGLIVGLTVIYLTPSPGQGSFRDSLNSLWKRMTVEQTLGLDYVLYKLVPIHGFYYGETAIWDFTWTISDLTQGIIFPLPHPSLTNHIANLIAGYKTHYAVTTMIMGDLYANWGLIGVIIGCILYGFILGILYTVILRMKKTIIFFPFWAYLSWIFVRAASTGAPIAFFLSQFASLCLVYLTLLSIYTYLYLPFAKRLGMKRRENYAGS